jgi:Zn-dependent M16 (insulinase) family peptidase
MEALRSLTVDQSMCQTHEPWVCSLNIYLVREYHKQYYVPHNLSLIITGKMSKGTPSILSVLQKEVEPSIIGHGQNRGPRPVGWKRPFLETPSANRPPIAKAHQEATTFPEKDESLGELVISYLGPPPSEFLERKVRGDGPSRSSWRSNWVSFQALDILSVYLTSSPVAPLNKEYVEVETPLW